MYLRFVRNPIHDSQPQSQKLSIMRETPFSFNLIYWILSDVTAVDLLVILGIDA